jgi:hypothetical protein
MKFKATDTCFEDYARRRDAYLKHVTRTIPKLKDRYILIEEWIDENSPWEPHEKLQNLRRAIFGDEKTSDHREG